jgi:hypothetical protein
MVNWTPMGDKDILKQDVQEWIKIAVETDADINPGNDTTGELSTNNRLSNGKWFLMGSFDNEGQVFRDLANYTTIQSNTNVLIIAVSTDQNTAESHSRQFSVDQLKAAAKQIFDIHEVVEIIIDGVLIDRNNGLQMVATDVIDVVFPENNVYKDSGDAQAGPAKLFCLAWAYERSFPPGEHEIVIVSNHQPSDEIGVGGFNQDVKYRIKVV